MSERNWFDSGGAAYAEFRPTYPPALIDYLARLAPMRTTAVDVGCGNGQLTVQLAESFDSVIGLDPSAAQLASALTHPGVQYRQATAESLPVEDGTAALITAAQAAHWFDLPAFYREARRIASPGAALALITYGKQRFLDERFDARFQQFYVTEIGPYWPPERRLVDEGYRTLDFPFEELEPPSFEIRQAFDLPALLGYLSTWSATRNAREAGRTDLLETFAGDIGELWGPAEDRHDVVWPISLRVTRL